MSWHFRLFIIVASSAMLVGTCLAQDTADWTVMVYLNGDNNLVDYATMDFYEMAHVGSSRHVNIVVQFDRLPQGNDWAQTLRFLVANGMPPEIKYAYEDLGEVDMAAGGSVKKFVESSMAKFPAKHYAFVLWGHGFGARYEMATPSMLSSFRSYRETAVASQLCTLPLLSSLTPVSYKGGTYDESNPAGTKQILYMRELADALRSALSGKRLDVFIFDECLMAMAENAYALRDTVSYMVASEEMIPLGGLDYADWLATLVANPAMSPSALAKTIVESYGKTYQGKFDCMTMSATNLGQAGDMARAISKLADVLSANLQKERDAIAGARQESLIYGDPSCEEGDGCFYNIDIIQFCRLLLKHSANVEIRNAARDVIAVVGGATVSVAGDATQLLKGSNGLAIYFPPTGSAYCLDVTNECGYEDTNQYFPMEFVQNEHWGRFLHDYFYAVPGTALSGCKSAMTNCTSPF